MHRKYCDSTKIKQYKQMNYSVKFLLNSPSFIEKHKYLEICMHLMRLSRYEVFDKN